jgi:DNA-binding NtrC family response regulator
MKKKTILLVEDDEVVRTTIKRALETKYTVLEASGYRDVMRQLKKNIDLALVDFIHPDTNGLVALKVLREVNNPKLPVIIMTAYESKALAKEANKRNATAYIKKPVESAYLKKMVSKMLSCSK